MLVPSCVPFPTPVDTAVLKGHLPSSYSTWASVICFGGFNFWPYVPAILSPLVGPHFHSSTVLRKRSVDFYTPPFSTLMAFQTGLRSPSLPFPTTDALRGRWG
uniref:Uncharacterized protein n=1 Tax=Sphaerodactylus townsendi TaxID=933632 RepID=A0ACB8F989_9SAUR